MSDKERLEVEWRKVEGYEDDLGDMYVAGLRGWTFSGQITSKQAHPGNPRNLEINLYIIDFDEVNPFVVKHDIIWVDVLSQAFNKVEESLGAYAQHISGLEFEKVKSNRNRYTT